MGTLQFVAFDFLGPLPRTASGIQHVIVIADRYTTLTGAIPTSRTTATDVVNALFNHWVIRYNIPKFLLTDSGPQFGSKFFATICLYLGVKSLTMTEYRPQKNGRWNNTTRPSPRAYATMLPNLKRTGTCLSSLALMSTTYKYIVPPTQLPSALL